MRIPSRLAILVWVWLAACLPSALAQTPGLVVNKIFIRFVGPPPVSEEFIRANVRIKVGDVLTSDAANEDVKRLYDTGYFFKINIASEPDAGGLDLTYIVQGKPILTEIRIVGNKLMSLKKIKKKITSRVGQPLDERKLFDDAQAIKELYEKGGYQKTTVAAEDPVINEATGRGTDTIVIHEMPKVKIKDIVFVNATAFKQRSLRKAFKKTKRRWMFSWLTGSGVLKEDDFEDDKDSLVEYYQNHGYIDFAILDIKFDYISPKWMIIRVIVSEGQQYKVGAVDFKGNVLFTTNDFFKGVIIDKQLMRLKEAPGEIFNPSDFSADVDTLRDMYGARGYLDPQNRGSTIVIPGHTANPTTGTMDLSYDIQEGEKNYIEKIIIKGNVKTKDRVLRRELAVYPGEVYDMVRVKISKQILEQMDYFGKVDAQAEDTDVPNHKDLVIGVEEKQTGSFSIGAGFSSDESIVGTVEVRQGNFDLFNPPTFTGAGQKLQLRLSVGTLLQSYDLNFIEPWFLGKRLIFGIDLFHNVNYYSALHGDYNTTSDGGTLSLTKALGLKALKGTISYTMEDVHLAISQGYEPYPTTNYFTGPNGFYEPETYNSPNVSTNILADRGSYLISKVGLSLEYDTRNSLKLPDAGQDTAISAQVATPPGDTEFYKLELRTGWFFKGFGSNQVLEIDARGGVASTWGNTAHVPIFEHYFLGGMYSLRGYRYETVGPLDYLGEALGGDTYWFASAEYSIPLLKNSNLLRYALFYDIGQVYPGSFSFSPGTDQEGSNIIQRKFFNDDIGMGLRIILPIGGGTPLRLDYGVPIVRDPTATKWGRFQFGIGYQRNF
ncbi:MAG TPA: outer membrane protein assembly factor BamA [Verrucomicrobiae bacterium]